MNELTAIAGALSVIASICTIWLFAEDRISKFRLGKRRNKMGSKRK